jgi:hypothetical protein
MAFLVSCTNREAFEAKKWVLEGDDRGTGGEREQMVDDLLQRYHVVGARYPELEKVLGHAELQDVFGHRAYLLKMEWDMIDPDYTKYLMFTIGKDSIIRKYDFIEYDGEPDIRDLYYRGNRVPH